MKIAIIVDNQDYQVLLGELIRGYESWEVEFFSSSSDFGRSSLQNFDVIISDYCLPSVNGRELLKSIQNKTSAELYLMSAEDDIFKEEDIQNDNINGLISKSDSKDVIENIKYCEAKIRINKLSEAENNKLSEIVANGFSIETRGNVAIIKIETLLGEESRKKIIDQLDRSRITKAVITFPKRKLLTSSYLGLIVSLFKKLKERKGKIVFWNSTKSPLVRENIISCKLDKIFATTDTLEEALLNLR